MRDKFLAWVIGLSVIAFVWCIMYVAGSALWEARFAIWESINAHKAVAGMCVAPVITVFAIILKG
jgi:hypothetical protein